ncbi:MAG: hypothetical protein EOP34_04430 [Rickettsiales bacterium]|nr:MAG: hypothetical protein EOP34_04430 [Rickettsiales bacterium]
MAGNISNTGIAAISNTAIYGSNTSFYASNTAIYSSNTAIYGSNTSYYTSNVITLTSNTAYFASNTSIYSSNTAVYASNYTSNLASGSSATYSSNAALFASNISVYSSNVLTNNLVSFVTSNLITSNLSFGTQSGVVTSRVIVGNITTPGQNIFSPGSAGGATTYCGTLILKPGDVNGNFWGGNPSNYGADLLLQAGNIFQGTANNGTAFVSGFGGNVRIMPGYSYVSSAGAANNRYVESGKIYFYNTNTNGFSIDTSSNICAVFDNYGRLGLANSNPQYQLDVKGDINSTGIIYNSNLSGNIIILSNNNVNLSNAYNQFSNLTQTNIQSLSNYSLSNITGISKLYI